MNQFADSWMDMFRSLNDGATSFNFDQITDHWKKQTEQFRELALKNIDAFEGQVMQALELQEQASLELTETASKFLMAPEAFKESLRWMHELTTESVNMRRTVWERAFDNTRAAFGKEWSEFVTSAADGGKIIDFMEKLSTQAFQTQTEMVSQMMPEAASATKTATKATTTTAPKTTAKRKTTTTSSKTGS